MKRNWGDLKAGGEGECLMTLLRCIDPVRWQLLRVMTAAGDEDVRPGLVREGGFYGSSGRIYGGDGRLYCGG